MLGKLTQIFTKRFHNVMCKCHHLHHRITIYTGMLAVFGSDIGLMAGVGSR